MFSRDSVRRHHPCAKLHGITTDNKYFLILSSEREPADVQSEAQSDTEEDEELEVISSDNSIVTWQAHSQSSATPDHTFFMGALQIQQNQTQQHQRQLFEHEEQLRDQRYQQDELARQVQRLEALLEWQAGQQQQVSPTIDPQPSASTVCKLPELQSNISSYVTFEQLTAVYWHYISKTLSYFQSST